MIEFLKEHPFVQVIVSKSEWHRYFGRTDWRDKVPEDKFPIELWYNVYANRYDIVPSRGSSIVIKTEPNSTP